MSNAPDAIFLQWHGDGDPEWDNGAPEYADVTWAAERVFDGDIEYRRADIADDDTIQRIAELEVEIKTVRRIAEDIIHPAGSTLPMMQTNRAVAIEELAEYLNIDKAAER